MLKFYKSGSRVDYQNQVDPPTGSIVAFPVATPPAGWLLCQGQTVSQSTYSSLYSAIGTAYNDGNESPSDFRLPNLQSRIPIGSGTGLGLSSRTRGATGGVDAVTLTAAQTGVKGHTHTVTETAHTHTVANDQHRHGIGFNAGASISINAIAGNATAFDFTNPLTAPANTTQLTFAVSAPVGGWYTIASNSTGMTVSSIASAAAPEAHTNVQPSLVMAYIIKS